MKSTPPHLFSSGVFFRTDECRCRRIQVTPLIILQCVSLMLAGCTGSEQALHWTSGEDLSQDRDLSIQLADGSSIATSSYLVVEDGSEFVYGIDGTLCDSAGKEKGDVEGVVRPISEKKWKHTDDAGVDRDEVVSHAWFQLQDGSLARFEEGKYVRVSAADSNSIVCIGTRHTEAEETDFAGQVAMSDIRRITTEEADVVGTVALITLGAAAVGLVIVFANIDMGTIKVASYN